MLKTLEPLEEGRKCFRLVGGVLVEQNVGVVRPTVQGNMDNLKLVSADAGVLCVCAVFCPCHWSSL